MNQLQLRPNTLQKRNFDKQGYFNVTVEISRKAIVDYLQSDSTAHLYRLYDMLCDLLEVVSGTCRLSLNGTDASPRYNEDLQMADAVKNCLKRIGLIFRWEQD